ncbi:MAG: hypothetical protein WD602_06505 [Actinomycetota bacterium]
MAQESRSTKSAFRLLGLLVTTVLALPACGDTPELTQTLTSENGLQMQIPESWSEDTELNPVADLQASNREAESYVVVISDLKQDLTEDLTLQEFGEFAVDEFMASLSDPNLSFSDLSEPRELEISGFDARRYELNASPGELDLSYLFTVIETSDRFLQVIAWTERPRLDDNRATLEAVTDSVSQT